MLSQFGYAVMLVMLGMNVRGPVWPSGAYRTNRLGTYATQFIREATR
jgi:hypothetical protein